MSYSPALLGATPPAIWSQVYPATEAAVIVRTSANVTTPLATITHGTIMLVCMLAITIILNMIPLAALSAVLFLVGYRLTSIAHYKIMFQSGKRQLVPFIITIRALMFTDLKTDIIKGGAVSAFVILRDNYRTPFFFDKKEHHEGETVELKLSEEVTFLNKASIMLTLDHVAPNPTVIIDASRSVNIDDDVLEIIREFKDTVSFKNIDLRLFGLDKFYKRRQLVK